MAAPKTSAVAAEASPRQCYISYLTALYYAKDLKAIAQYFPKAQRDIFKTMNAQQQQKRLDECKNQYVGHPEILSEKIEGDKAHLTAKGVVTHEGHTLNADVTVDLIHEDGYWRLLNSSYRGNIAL
jgi:hypothetical protein